MIAQSHPTAWTSSKNTIASVDVKSGSVLSLPVVVAVDAGGIVLVNVGAAVVFKYESLLVASLIGNVDVVSFTISVSTAANLVFRILCTFLRSQ